MTLVEALQVSRFAHKHVDGPPAGNHTVSKANISAGYYADFIPDDPAQRLHVSTSFYWDSDDLPKIESYAGADSWEPTAKPCTCRECKAGSK